MTAKRTPLELEILRQLRLSPQGLLGLEDRCNEWRSPDELRVAVGQLLVEALIEAYDREPMGVGFRLTETGIAALKEVTKS